MNHLSPVSVVIPTHSEKRWTSLMLAVESAKAQVPAPAEIVVVVDHNPRLFDKARHELDGVTVLANRYARGVSGNRNTGAFHTITPLIAFLDDDARAHAGWLAALLAPFDDPRVVGTGGAIRPAWAGRRPQWLPDEFLWTVGATYTGLPTGTAPVRNVWSGSMAVRRDAFVRVGGFRTGFGKVGDRPSPEDTELCVRMGATWMFVPDAVIHHPVEPARMTFSFFVRRCFQEGRGKVQMAGLLDGRDTLGAENAFLRRTVPAALRRNLGRVLRGGGLTPLSRAGAVAAGVAAAAAGGFIELTTTPRMVHAIPAQTRTTIKTGVRR